MANISLCGRHEQVQELLPGLPDILVTDFILPRLPWYTRPRMLTVSKTWKESLQTLSSHRLLLRTRELHHPTGLLVFHELRGRAREVFHKTCKATARREQYYELPTTVSGKSETLTSASSSSIPKLKIVDSDIDRLHVPSVSTLNRTHAVHHAVAKQAKSETALSCRTGTGEAVDGMIANFKKVNIQSRRMFAISMLDPGSQTWRRLPPIPTCASGVPASCTFVSAYGKVYVLGGVQPDVVDRDSNMVYELDIAGGTWWWERRASMILSRAFAKCALLDMKIYMLGGTSWGEVYDIPGDHWERLPDMSDAQFFCNGVVAVKNQVIAYGYNIIDEETNVTSARVFDIPSACWSNAAEFQFAFCCTSSPSNVIYSFVNDALVAFDASLEVTAVFIGNLEINGVNTEKRSVPSGQAYHIHDLVAVEVDDKPPDIYALASPRHNKRQRSIWRGTIDKDYFVVVWRSVYCPLELYVSESVDNPSADYSSNLTYLY